MNGFHNADAPATFTDQKTAGAAARTEETSSSTVVSDGPLPDLNPSSSLKKEQDQGEHPAQQLFSSAAAPQAGHSGQNGLPSKQASQTGDSSHQPDSSFRDGHDAPAWVGHSNVASSDKQVTLHPCPSPSSIPLTVVVSQ